MKTILATLLGFTVRVFAESAHDEPEQKFGQWIVNQGISKADLHPYASVKLLEQGKKSINDGYCLLICWREGKLEYEFCTTSFKTFPVGVTMEISLQFDAQQPVTEDWVSSAGDALQPRRLKSDFLKDLSKCNSLSARFINRANEAVTVTFLTGGLDVSTKALEPVFAGIKDGAKRNHGKSVLDELKREERQDRGRTRNK